MRYEQKQKKIEQKTYDFIDEIANEFDLKVPFYPEIYWVGQKLKFEKLGIKKTAKNMKDLGVSIEIISKSTGLSIEDINKL